MNFSTIRGTRTPLGAFCLSRIHLLLFTSGSQGIVRVVVVIVVVLVATISHFLKKNIKLNTQVQIPTF